MTPQTDWIGTEPITRATARRAALEAARERADTGMDRAARRAERLHAGFCLLALEAVRKFASNQAGVWTIEQMRNVLEAELPPASDRRVWGKITVDAIKAGYIERVPKVFIPAATSNGSPKPAWRRGQSA